MARRMLVLVVVGCGVAVSTACGGDQIGDHQPVSTAGPVGSAVVEADGADAEDVTDKPQLRLSEPIAEIPDAVDLRVRPATDQIYVADRRGTIHRIGESPALDLSDTLEESLEQGLLAIAFAPDGDLVYLNIATESSTQILEYRVDDDGTVDRDSERPVLEFAQPYEGHNGGDLMFDDTGHLLIFSGDGGFVGDPDRTAQDLSVPLGKILRIDPTPTDDQGFGVPTDNPFLDEPGFGPIVWAAGLRNPWRGHFDHETGDLWIGDVGEFTWEEINVGWAADGSGRAANFGWSAYEGPDRFNLDQVAEDHRPPFHVYPHDGERCSIVGGKVYRGDAIAELEGWFVFTDFCDGRVRAIEVERDRSAGRKVLADGQVNNPVSIRTGSAGELYVVSILGEIVRIEPAV